MSEQATQTAKEQKQQATTPASTMTEAGFSMNVKMEDEHGQEVMLTFRCALASNSKALIGHYSNTVKDLLGGGWKPIKAGVRPAGNSGGGGAAAPKCPIHGAVMKESNKKAGMFYCPRKNADQSYCNQKVGGDD
jgi:hypothetical protein